MQDKWIVAADFEVRAFLDKRKTQIRRLVKGRFSHDPHGAKHAKWYFKGPKMGGWDSTETVEEMSSLHGPFGQAGDKLSVKHKWYQAYAGHRNEQAWDEYTSCIRWKHTDREILDVMIWEAAGLKEFDSPIFHKRSPVTMPRWASRITLTVEKVWVHRVQDISEEDAAKDRTIKYADSLKLYEVYWKHNKKHAGCWERNDWVWAAEVKAEVRGCTK